MDNFPNGQFAAISSICSFRGMRTPGRTQLQRNFRFKERYNLHSSCGVTNIFNRCNTRLYSGTSRPLPPCSLPVPTRAYSGASHHRPEQVPPTSAPARWLPASRSSRSDLKGRRKVHSAPFKTGSNSPPPRPMPVLVVGQPKMVAVVPQSQPEVSSLTPKAVTTRWRLQIAMHHLFRARLPGFAV